MTFFGFLALIYFFLSILLSDIIVISHLLFLFFFFNFLKILFIQHKQGRGRGEGEAGSRLSRERDRASSWDPGVMT